METSPVSRQVEEIESLCMNCRENGVTRILITSIPYFKDVAIMSFECQHCNTLSNGLHSISDMQEKGIRYKVKCTKDEDLQRQVVKTEWSEIKIPEIEFEVKRQPGLVTTIEGILERAEAGMKQLIEMTPNMSEEDLAKIKNFLKNLMECKLAKIDFTFILDDPSGNSYVSSLAASSIDPQLDIIHYTRTRDQNLLLGILDSGAESLDIDEPIGANEVMQSNHINLESDLLKFLEANKNDFSLVFLQNIHETFMNLKTTEPEKDFNDYLNDLKNCHANYSRELNQLRDAKEDAEYKYLLMKEKYEKELSFFNETKIENIVKNSGAREHLEYLKDKIRQKDEIIASQKSDLKSKRNEAQNWQAKCKEAEEHSSVYWQKWKDTQVIKEQLEAEKKARIEKDRRVINQAFNHSTTSSFLDNSVPPPPPIDVPSVDEMLRFAGQGQSSPANLYTSMELSPSIPPPPPVEVPFNEIMKHLKLNHG